MGTHWELKRNIVGWEPGENEKKSTPHRSPKNLNLKGKKARHLECMLGSSNNWVHEISLPKRVHYHFWHGLIIPLAKNTLSIHQNKSLYVLLDQNFKRKALSNSP
jgi:hypothetical protein